MTGKGGEQGLGLGEVAGLVADAGGDEVGAVVDDHRVAVDVGDAGGGQQRPGGRVGGRPGRQARADVEVLVHALAGDAGDGVRHLRSRRDQVS